MVTHFLSYLFKTAFQLLYHELSWTYDWVAALASAGKWKEWVFCALPYLTGPKVLELGFGPGYLQVKLAEEGFEPFGIDESPQMARHASNKISKLRLSDHIKWLCAIPASVSR